jgi:hypothetical protein
MTDLHSHDPNQRPSLEARLLTWIGLGLLLAFIAWMAWGLIQEPLRGDHERFGQGVNELRGDGEATN